jgi:hypothetical protein
MARVAPRVHTDQATIARLEAIGRELIESRHVRVRLIDDNVIDGIVEMTPSIQVFFDPDGREGMNAVLRLEAFLDDGRPHAGGIHDVWLDEIEQVTRLPNPSPPEPSRRSPADPNAPAPDVRQPGTDTGVASNRRA